MLCSHSLKGKYGPTKQSDVRCSMHERIHALWLSGPGFARYAAGFVDTPLSAQLLGDQLEKRRNLLRTTLPIGRVVGPADVAALAVHIMTNTALTGATYDIDGGQQFVPA